jgi:hypothetical protein
MSYETRFLEAVKTSVQARISRHALTDVTADMMIEDITNSMLLRLTATVYEDPNVRKTDKHVIREQVSHPTWKHALIASLPKTALFRRRFLGYFFDIDPMWGGRRITHTVEVTRRGVFPDVRYPDSFGRIQYVYQTTPNYSTETL